MKTVKKDHKDETYSLSVEKVTFKISKEVKELVKSAELLSKKGSKRRLSLLQKQRGE